MKNILAHSAFVNPGEGCAKRRLVIREWNTATPYVVHKQYVYEDGSTSFDCGVYCSTFDRAWQVFVKRTAEELVSYPLADLNSERFQLFNKPTVAKGD